MNAVCCVCGCISEHLFTGLTELLNNEYYFVYRCIDCDSDFYIKKTVENKIESVSKEFVQLRLNLKI
jgi:hypothetical protein